MENDQDTKFDDAVAAGESYESPPPTPAEPTPAEPPEPPPPDAHCPNCNGPGIRKGKVIICEKCDASFRYTEEGPKVDELGPFDKLEQRVTDLEEKDGSGIVPAEPAKAEPAEPAKAEPAEPIEDDGI